MLKLPIGPATLTVEPVRETIPEHHHGVRLPHVTADVVGAEAVGPGARGRAARRRPLRDRRRRRGAGAGARRRGVRGTRRRRRRRTVVRRPCNENKMATTLMGAGLRQSLVRVGFRTGGGGRTQTWKLDNPEVSNFLAFCGGEGEGTGHLECGKAGNVAVTVHS